MGVDRTIFHMPLTAVLEGAAVPEGGVAASDAASALGAKGAVGGAPASGAGDSAPAVRGARICRLEVRAIGRPSITSRIFAGVSGNSSGRSPNGERASAIALIRVGGPM